MTFDLRLPFLSLQISVRAVAISIALLLLAVMATAQAMAFGSYPMTVTQILSVLGGKGDTVQQMILMDHRLPRILAALGAGMAFGLSGAMFQTMLRNPLASPDVIGFTAGASFGAILALILSGGAVLMGALLGGLGAAAAVLLLAWKDGLQPYRLILTGVGVSLFLTAASDLALSKMDSQNAADMAQWLIGTLNARNWSDVSLIWGGLILTLPLVIWLSFALNRMILSDESSISLGLNLTRLRFIISVTGVSLVALAVSVAGPLPFVAFVAGPIARAIMRNGRPALFAAGLIGALITLIADMAARVLPMAQLPTGVFTALIGAPVLMWLLMIQFRKGRL